MNGDIKILIVDDDPDVLFATTRILRSEGYEVLNASSAAQCKTMVQENRPDLVLLDVMLPDGNGTALCKEFKSDPDLAGIFIVLLSGLKTSSIEQAGGLDVGADGYIVRPISNQELKARVNSMVRILSAERQRDRLIDELKDALTKVKLLSGLLPICSHCKNIRDDKGYWKQIESYIQEHSEVDFSHSICPDCAKIHYPDLDIYDEGND